MPLMSHDRGPYRAWLGGERPVETDKSLPSRAICSESLDFHALLSKSLWDRAICQE
jgi:hypothetical protein